MRPIVRVSQKISIEGTEHCGLSDELERNQWKIGNHSLPQNNGSLGFRWPRLDQVLLDRAPGALGRFEASDGAHPDSPKIHGRIRGKGAIRFRSRTIK